MTNNTQTLCDMPVLEISNVSFRYEGAKKNALLSVNARFEAGKVYALIGGAATGKTTLFSLIAGFLIPSAGDIFFKERSLRKLDRDAYRAKDLGCLFNGGNLLENESALANIETALRIGAMHAAEPDGRTVKNRAWELLSWAGLEEDAIRRKASRLTPEESRRAAIARTLANKPSLVIADEPIEGLEGEAAKDILCLLAHYAKQQNACVLILSRKPGSAAYADEIWGLNGGRLLFIR